DAANTNFYKLGAYSNMDFKGSVTEGPLEFSLGISNVLNSRSIGAVSINDKTITAGNGAVIATSANDIFNRPNSLDQYSFQPSRGFQLTVKARF
ncbi:MAG TPA: hypothetical protein VLL04_15585, partial [Rhizomicrobium sp.]|nr:hypothetical protein [Rhizomicrobium sp.]